MQVVLAGDVYFMIYWGTNFASCMSSKVRIKLYINSSLNLAVQRRRRRSERPHGLRRRSAAACLLRWWVRIPPGAGMFVMTVVCCQVEVSAMSWSLVQRSPTECGASFCVWSTNLLNKGALAHWGLSRQKPKNKKRIYTPSVVSFLHILTLFDVLDI